jgi:DNA-binding PadR family transcriptional regulator
VDSMDMQKHQRQKLVSDLDRRLQSIMQVDLSDRASKLFKFIWRSELAERQTDVTAAIVFLKSSRRPAYNAIYELEKYGLIARVTDDSLRRRKLLLITRQGWEILAAITAKYSDLVVNHVKKLEQVEANWVEFLDVERITPDRYSSNVHEICRWSTERGSEPVPTQFLDRIYVLEMNSTRPEAFDISYWGRGMMLQGGRDFAGEQLCELRKNSSPMYWQNGVDGVVGAFNSNASSSVTEITLRSANIEHKVQRVVVPDRERNRTIVGSWIVEAEKIPSTDLDQE